MPPSPPPGADAPRPPRQLPARTRHPASRARRLTATTSVTAMLLLSGYLALSAPSYAATAAADEVAAAVVTTVPTTTATSTPITMAAAPTTTEAPTTTTTAAVAAEPAAQAQTTSKGS